MRRFITYYFHTFFRPADTFSKLLGEQKQVIFGFRSVLITAILYTLVYIFLILGGGQPFKPWLDIPLETYYRYNVFFCAPSMFLGWILAAGTVHTLCCFVTDQGRFENILSLLGFGIGIASWTTGIHDLTTSFLGALHIIDQRGYEVALNSPTIWRTLLWVQMIAYLLWFILLFTIAVRSVYKLKVFPSLLIGTLAFLIYQLFFLIFNR